MCLGVYFKPLFTYVYTCIPECPLGFMYIPSLCFICVAIGLFIIFCTLWNICDKCMLWLRFYDMRPYDVHTMGPLKSFIMNNNAFRNLFCNPQKSFHTSPTWIIEAINHSSNSTIEFWSVTSSNFLFCISAFSWPYISVEHDEKPSHTKFDMNWSMLAWDMATWIPN